MSFKLAIGNIVQVPVKLTMKEGAVNRSFAFTLTANRKTPEETEALGDVNIKDFLLDNVTDWSDQRLVLTENDEPAAFSRDAFDYMLKLPGVLGVVWVAYQRETAGKEKN